MSRKLEDSAIQQLEVLVLRKSSLVQIEKEFWENILESPLLHDVAAELGHFVVFGFFVDLQNPAELLQLKASSEGLDIVALQVVLLLHQGNLIVLEDLEDVSLGEEKVLLIAVLGRHCGLIQLSFSCFTKVLLQQVSQLLPFLPDFSAFVQQKSFVALLKKFEFRVYFCLTLVQEEVLSNGPRTLLSHRIGLVLLVGFEELLQGNQAQGLVLDYVLQNAFAIHEDDFVSGLEALEEVVREEDVFTELALRALVVSSLGYREVDHLARQTDEGRP